MTYNLNEALSILERTPAVLDAFLRDLPEAWTSANEGPDTWSAYDILGHLIHGERTDWIPRIRRVLDEGESRAFEPFDRFAQQRESVGKSASDLLDEFAAARRANLEAFRGLGLKETDLDRRGLHPSLGAVTMRNLLATWVAHDLGHIAQISRVMAKRYTEDIGPWIAYLPVVRDRPRPDS
jgi:uncharacterized damage-inducible protein DinB